MNLRKDAKLAYEVALEAAQKERLRQQEQARRDKDERDQRLAQTFALLLSRAFFLEIDGATIFASSRFREEKIFEVEGVLLTLRWCKEEPYLAGLIPCPYCKEYDESFPLKNLADLGHFLEDSATILYSLHKCTESVRCHSCGKRYPHFHDTDNAFQCDNCDPFKKEEEAAPSNFHLNEIA